MLSYNLRNVNTKLPKVFVTSIDLSVGKVEKSAEDPHITRINPDLLSEHTQTVNPMKVKVSMCIKDANPIQLFQNKAAKNIKIAVVQVTSPSMKNKIKDNPFLYLPTRTNQKRRAGISSKFYSLQEFFPKNITPIMNSGAGKERSLYSLSEEEKIPFSTEMNLDGTLAYNIPLHAEFIIPAESGGVTINNLCYYCYAFVDLENSDTFSSFSFYTKKNATSLHPRDIMGPITAESVIEDARIKNNSFAFTLREGKIWTGPVHEMNAGNWMTGLSHGPHSLPLTKISLPNLKIKDHRIADRISLITFQGGSSNGSISNRQKALSRRFKDGMQNEFVKVPPKVSEIYLSRDKQNKCRFFFSVDIEQIIKQNSNFPALVDNLKNTNYLEYRQLIQSAKIEEISISRRRVKNQETVSSSQERISYSPTDQERIVAISSDTIGERKLKSQIHYNRSTVQGVGNRQSSKNGSIMEIEPFASQDSMGLRHFTGTDMEVSRESHGMYEYTVEIRIKDPVQPYVKSKLRLLRNIIGNRSTRGTSGLSGLSLDSYYTDATKSVGNYDSLLERFNTSFIEKFNPQYSQKDNNFLFTSINKFVSMLYTMADQNSLDRLPMIDVVNYLTNISSPSTGSPEGILKLVQIMEGVENSLETTVSSNKSYNKPRDTSSEATNSNSNVGKTSRTKMFVVKKVFKNRFSSSTQQVNGFDYLFGNSDTVEPNENGIVSISKDFFKNRCDMEVQKYFKSKDPNVTIKNKRGDTLNKGDGASITKYSFLSPSNIFLETKNKRVVFESIKSAFVSSNRKEMNNLLNDIVTHNITSPLMSSKSTDSDDRDVISASSISDALALSGATIELARDSKSRNGLSDSGVGVFNKESQSRSIDKGDRLFETNRDEDDMLMKTSKDFMQSVLQVSETDFLKESNSMYTYLFDDDDSAEKLKNQLSRSLLKRKGTPRRNAEPSTQSPFNRSPIHLKALVLSLQNSSEVKENKALQNNSYNVDIFKDPENYGFLWFNYKSIKMIEVLVGFEASVNSPIWTRLQENHLDSSSNRALICRMVPYSDTMTGIEENEKIKLPTFNEIFVINVGRDANKAKPISPRDASPPVTLDENPRSSFIRNAYTEGLQEVSSYYKKRALYTEPTTQSFTLRIRPEFASSLVAQSYMAPTQVSARLANKIQLAMRNLTKNLQNNGGTDMSTSSSTTQSPQMGSMPTTGGGSSY